MRSSLQRARAFDARMQSSEIDPVLTAINAQQKANHAAHVGYFYPKQLLLRDYLNSNALTGPTAFQYEAFNAECYAIARRFSGPAAVAHVTVLATKYFAQGLDAAHLVAIALLVWGWTIPLPGPVQHVAPLDGAPAEPKDGTLVWVPAANATGYDVWLYIQGNPPAEVSHNQAGNTYAYAGLLALTVYEWYIVPRNFAGTGPTHPAWTFTTVA